MYNKLFYTSYEKRGILLHLLLLQLNNKKENNYLVYDIYIYKYLYQTQELTYSDDRYD